MSDFPPITQGQLDNAERDIARLYGVEPDAVRATASEDGTSIEVVVKLPIRPDTVQMSFDVKGRVPPHVP